jgi:hypothetical protein
MLTRVYYILGGLMILGYGVAAYEGWEFASAVRMAAAPPAGSMVSSSGGRWYWVHSSTYTSDGRGGSGVGGFGGK